MKYLMDAQKGSEVFGNTYRWSGTPFGKSDQYRGKLKNLVDAEMEKMEFQWNNDVWKASHRTSEDYINWAKKNPKENLYL